MTQPRNYLLIGTDEQKQQFAEEVDRRIQWLRSNAFGGVAVDWNELAHKIRLEVAEKIGLSIKWSGM